MTALGPFLLGAPWALAALVALPLIWWVLRATPPAPKNVELPSLRLLDGAVPVEDAIQQLLDKYGLGKERIAVRIAGCPNGCSRPYVGDIGIVGRTPDTYALYIGGDFEGTRLNTKITDKTPTNGIAAALEPYVARFKTERNAGEGFGDFWHRVGIS